MFNVVLDAQPRPLGTSHDKSFVFKIEAKGKMRNRVKAFDLAGTVLAKFEALKRINCVIDVHVGVNKYSVVPNGCVYAFDGESYQIALATVDEIALAIQELHLTPVISMEFYLEMRSLMEDVA